VEVERLSIDGGVASTFAVAAVVVAAVAVVAVAAAAGLKVERNHGCRTQSEYNFESAPWMMYVDA
jgi:hypothetical protein